MTNDVANDKNGSKNGKIVTDVKILDADDASNITGGRKWKEARKKGKKDKI